MIYIAVIFTFLLIWAGLSAIFVSLAGAEKPIDKLKLFDEEYSAKEKPDTLKKSGFSILRLLSGLIPDMKMGKKRGRKLEEELLKADIPITIQELLVIKIISSSCIAFFSYAILRNIIAVIIVFLFLWNLPNLIILNKKKQRIKQFDSQLSEGNMIISNSLKAGYSFFQAISTVAEETKDPFSKEFKKLLKEMSFGIPEEDALKNLLVRMDSDDLRLVINAILIQKDIGGNLSEILDNIDETIRERQKIQNELKTLTSQGKLSGLIVIILPFFLGGVIYLLNRGYIMSLFTSPIGLAMLGVSAANMLFGILVIKKIINIDI